MCVRDRDRERDREKERERDVATIHDAERRQGHTSRRCTRADPIPPLPAEQRQSSKENAHHSQANNWHHENANFVHGFNALKFKMIRYLYKKYWTMTRPPRR
jgi:hypothetical protein